MKTKKIKFKAAIIAVAAVLILSVGGTFAYLQTGTNTATNVFQRGVINITVDEDFDGTPITSDGVEKKVRVKNDSLDGQLNVAPCYVRVALVATWVNEDGTVAAVDANSLITYTFAEADDNAQAAWVEGADGYYYYTGVLEPDEMTTDLLEMVTLSSEAPESGHLEINVLADGVQETKAAEAWGNPTLVDGTEIFQ